MQTEEYKNAESTISNVQIYEIDLSKCGHQLTAVNIKKKQNVESLIFITKSHAIA